MKTPRLDVSRALSVEYHRTETWMLLCSACLGKLAGRGERKEREKVVYSRGKLKPTFIVANNPTSRAGVPGQSGGLALEQKTQTAARHAPVHTSWRLTHERIPSQRWRQLIEFTTMTGGESQLTRQYPSTPKYTETDKAC